MDGRRVYVASELGFHAPGRSYLYKELLPSLSGRGLQPLDPWADETGEVTETLARAGAAASEEKRVALLTELNRAVGARNLDLISQAAAVLALLDGADVDSGVAAEIGYAAGQGVPIVGWRSDFRRGGDNAATPVNLQLGYFVERSGGKLVSSLDQALDFLERLLARRD